MERVSSLQPFCTKKVLFGEQKQNLEHKLESAEKVLLIFSQK